MKRNLLKTFLLTQVLFGFTFLANSQTCTPITSFPWTEGFESGIPTCWTQEYVSNSLSWITRNGSQSGNGLYAHSGNNNAYMHYYPYQSITKLVTPQLNLQNKTATLKFWHAQESWSDTYVDKLKVYYRTSASGTWNLLATYTNEFANWTEETIALPNTSGDYYIAFEGSVNDGWGVVLDDIEITATLPAPLPKITAQPEGGSVCMGSNYTFTVAATGGELSYQWYKSNNPILGANTNTLTINNATSSDYANYYVVVKNETGTTSSNLVTLWVADYLPNLLQFAECPEKAITGTKYRIALAGYMDVTKYTWSYSTAGAIFNPVSGKNNETTVTFPGSITGKGTITATLEHVCGTRTVTKDITVQWPTGIESAENSLVWVGPNPTKDFIKIQGGNTINEVIVTDMSGRMVYKVKPNSETHQISAINWVNGVYLVKVITGSSGNVSSKTYKIVKN